MKHFSEKIKLHLTRAAAVLLVFGGAWLVLTYCLGYYDISFIDREAIMGGHIAETVPDDTDGKHNETADLSETTEDETAAPDTAESEEIASVLSLHDSSLLPAVPAEYSPLSEKEGYLPAASAYVPRHTTLSEMALPIDLPTEFSLNEAETEEIRYVVREEYGAYEAEYVSVTAERPAVTLYMGNLLLDRGDELLLLDADGNPLFSFDGGTYRPAYTRDTEGRPLFLRVGEDGTETYCRITDDGKGFIASDYNDARDNRGLYFDYPRTYGLSDNGFSRVFDEEEGTYDYGTEWGDVTYSDFTHAYAFSEGLACVASNRNNGGMFFINEQGARVQDTFVTFLSGHDRYFIWDYAKPASFGIESLGFFYFDHGLTRVRYQVIDNYHWYTLGEARIVSDEDRLLRTDGTFFDLPGGFTLKGYSDGMILLEKDGRYGFMDYTGGWIAEPIYASATPFLLGLAVLETEDGRCGMIDTEGNIVLPFAYDHISGASDGRIAAYREDEGWTVYRVMEPIPEETVIE